jgi:hypothetical protein
MKPISRSVRVSANSWGEMISPERAGSGRQTSCCSGASVGVNMPWSQVRSAMANAYCERVSFAKTASAAMSLRCNAFITVMKTAQLRDCDNPADTRDLPREGTLLVEPQMGSGPMVVTEIRSQGSLQMPRVQDDEMVQAVSSYRADQTFGVGVLPGTPGRGE